MGSLSSPPVALPAPVALLNLWLVQTPKKVCNFRLTELCVFCFITNLLFFPIMTTGLAFHSLLQIKYSPNAKFFWFYSPAHPDKTTLQTELWRREIRDTLGNKAVDSHTSYSKFLQLFVNKHFQICCLPKLIPKALYWLFVFHNFLQFYTVCVCVYVESLNSFF